MSFSFRSLFQRDAASEERGQIAAPVFGMAHQGTAGSRPVNMSTQTATLMQPPAGASPFQLGGNPLFRTASNESVSAPPINSAQGMSPFNVVGATPTNAPLTVGDVISHLPPEVVRGGAVPVEQPLALPPTLLENALRSGQPALPLFELYRVCPALFQTPISPQDPRMVPLPASKLPSLIAKAREEHDSGGQMPQPGAPMQGMPGSSTNGQPPSPFQMARPPQAAESHGQAPAFPMSPFAAASPGFQNTPKPGAAAGNPSPFSAPSAQPSASNPFEAASSGEAGAAKAPHEPPAASQGSPFAMSNGKAPPSPFATGGGAQSAPSPFGSAAPAGGSPPQPMPSPFGSAAPASASAPPQSQPSPFGTMASSVQPAPSPFGTANPPPQTSASPFGSQSPGATAPQTMPSPFGAAGSAPQPSPFGAAAPAPATNPQPSITQLFSPKPPEGAPAASQNAPSGAGLAGFADAKFQQAAPPPAQQAQAPAPPAPAAGNGSAKLGLAALLRGRGAEELGFNPASVPAWIMTSLPSAALQQQAASGEVVMELGALIDGIIDVGFRNTLSSARRDLQIQLPQNEVFHALTQSAPAAAGASALQSAMPQAAGGAFVIQPNAPQGQVGRVDPAPAVEAPPVNPAPLPQAAAPVAHAPSLAQFAPGPTSGPMTPFAPKMGAAVNPFAEPTSSPPAAAHTPLFSPAAAEPPARTAFPSAPEAPPKESPQGLAGMFKPFGAPPANTSFGSAQSHTAAHAATPTKPFDPFASAGSIQGNGNKAPGFSSAQLLGQSAPEPSIVPSPFGGSHAPEPASKPFAEPVPVEPQAAERKAESPEPTPSSPNSSSQGLFASQPVSAEVPSPARPKPPVESGNGKMPAVKHSFLGLAPLDTQTDQLLLRALLGTEENLTAPRVVELLAAQAGLSACVCLHGTHVLSHADGTSTDAKEFQRQAPDIARQLRGLAPLIGIDGAETFTLNAGGRLLTFCFPDDTTVAVLHKDEPTTGLRDKITLISRELARLLG